MGETVQVIVDRPDGARLQRWSWDPSGEARAVVCLVHGIGEHLGRFQVVANQLAQAGFAVRGQDSRGHGGSSGTRGDLRLEPTLDDLEDLLDEVTAQNPGLPVFLYGHSLGGLQVLTLLVRRSPRVAGVIATSPALASPLEGRLDTRIKKALARLLAPVLPGFTLPTGLSTSDLSRDPQVKLAADADPMYHDRGSFAWAKSMFAAMDAMKQVNEFPVPLLLLHGSDDPMCSAPASRAFAERIGAGVCTYLEYEGALHELHNELEKERVMRDIVAWLDTQLAAASA